jgi:hypothetical protein
MLPWHKERKGNLHAINSPLAFELWILIYCFIVDFMHKDFYGLQITNHDNYVLLWLFSYYNYWHIVGTIVIGCVSSLIVNVHIIKEKRKMTQAIITSQDTNPCTWVYRWRKCTVLVEKIVNDLFSDEHGLDVDERKETLWRICENERVGVLLLDYVQNAKET